MQNKKRAKTRKRTNSKRSRSWEDRESRDMKRDDKRMVEESTNDPAWYATDPSILRDAASFPFSWPFGRAVDLGLDKSEVIPGVAAMRLAPTVGTSETKDSPINVAAMSIYSFIRHANSGAKNYDPNDLMLYLLAMSNIYGAINWAQRAYAMASLYDQRNRYLPNALLSVQGIDPASLTTDLANFRYRLNVLINKVSSMAVPANMTIFSRIAFVYQNIYAETDTIKDQLYMYYPAGFYKYIIDSETSMGKLVFQAVPNNLTANSLLDYINDLFQAIWEQEDLGIMSGDILKAYGENIIKLVSMDEIVPIAPVMDQMVLLQFKNATTASVDASTLVIAQSNDGSILTHVPTATANDYMTRRNIMENKLLTLPVDNPTPEMVMEASRLILGYHWADTSGNPHINGCTEIPLGVKYATIDETTGDLDFYSGLVIYTVYINDRPASDVCPVIAKIGNFKYHPLVNLQSNQETDSVRYRFWEVDNYTCLTSQEIGKLHEAAMLNMLHVPSIGKAISSLN